MLTRLLLTTGNILQHRGAAGRINTGRPEKEGICGAPEEEKDATKHRSEESAKHGRQPGGGCGLVRVVAGEGEGARG